MSINYLGDRDPVLTFDKRKLSYLSILHRKRSAHVHCLIMMIGMSTVARWALWGLVPAHRCPLIVIRCPVWRSRECLCAGLCCVHLCALGTLHLYDVACTLYRTAVQGVVVNGPSAVLYQPQPRVRNGLNHH